MYLTRFRINTARLGARHLLSSPQQRMHAAVMSSFAGAIPSEENASRILWRLDRNSHAEVLLGWRRSVRQPSAAVSMPAYS